MTPAECGPICRELRRHAGSCEHAKRPDPLDVGAILRAALARSGLTAADLARMTDMAPANVSRALRSADTRPVVARRILAALGARVLLAKRPS